MARGKFGRLLFGLLALLATSSAARSACNYSGPSFDGNTTNISAKLTQTNKESCGHIFRTRGRVKVDHLMISTQPKHGRVGVKNSMSDPGFAYQPNAGFVGEDSFQVSLDEYSGLVDASHKMIVDVVVDVTP